MKPGKAAFIFMLLSLGAWAIRPATKQPPTSLPDSVTVLLVFNGLACIAIVLLTGLLWVWDIFQNTPEFRFRLRVVLGMFAPFALAFLMWSAEYFARTAGYSGMLLQLSTIGVPLLLVLSGFEMTGLRDGERIHPLLGAYTPSSSFHHPLPWITPSFALYTSVAATASVVLIINGVSSTLQSARGIFADSIEAAINSGAVFVLGLGLLRVLNARSFDLMSSWPAFLLFGHATFQWLVLWHPYRDTGGRIATVLSISLFIKACFVVSLLTVISSVHKRAQLRAKIMVSYRRDDSPTMTSRIYDRLTPVFGREQVFRDIDSIPLGINFRDYLDRVVSTCAVVLVVIGPKWLALKDKQGNRRLNDPDDFVRLEITLALKRHIPVVPLLVDGASYPPKAMLPEEIWELVDRQGMGVDGDPRFHRDIDRLIGRLQDIMNSGS
jgi:hypothetical protein